MKIERNGIIYEGTPDELKEFFPDLASTPLPEKPRLRIKTRVNVDPVEIMRRVLTRLPISDGQAALYSALYRAGEAGLSYKKLALEMDRTEQELAGVLGALGRRVNNTEGMYSSAGIELLLIVEQIDRVWHYIMKEEFRQVLDEQGFDWL